MQKPKRKQMQTLMSKADIKQTEEGQLTASGELTFFCARDLLKEGARFIRQAGSSLAIDFAGVTKFDSAAVALLLEWRKLALADNVLLAYNNIPDGLLAIARISEVEQMLA